jgi:hypothetical protein
MLLLLSFFFSFLIFSPSNQHQTKSLWEDFFSPFFFSFPLSSLNNKLIQSLLSMAIFTSPTSFRIANGLRSINQARTLTSQVEYGVKDLVFNRHTASPAHPSFLHLILLVFEAVLEVICVSLPGYIAARHGMFDSDAQKLVANLNVALFTPCLGRQIYPKLVFNLPSLTFPVFTKLASQLTAEKLTDLAIIPVIFVLQTLVSYLCSIVISRCFRFKKRQSNFVAAMAVSESPDVALRARLTAAGLREFQFSPYLARHVTLTDPAWPPLVPGARRQR